MSRTREIRGVGMGGICHVNRVEGLAALRRGCVSKEDVERVE